MPGWLWSLVDLPLLIAHSFYYVLYFVSKVRYFGMLLDVMICKGLRMYPSQMSGVFSTEIC